MTGEAAEEADLAVAVGGEEAEVPPPKFATEVLFFPEGHEQYRPALADSSIWSRARGFVFTALRRDRDPQRLDVGGGRSLKGESREACGARAVLRKFDLGEAWTHEVLEAVLRQAPLEMFW